MFKNLKTPNYFMLFILSFMFICNNVMADDMPAVVECGNGYTDESMCLRYFNVEEEMYPTRCSDTSNDEWYTINSHLGAAFDDEQWEDRPNIELGKCPASCSVIEEDTSFYLCSGIKDAKRITYFKDSFLIYYSPYEQKVYDYSIDRTKGRFNSFVNKEPSDILTRYRNPIDTWVNDAPYDWFTTSNLSKRLKPEDTGGQYGIKIADSDLLTKEQLKIMIIEIAVANKYEEFQKNFGPSFKQCDKYINGSEELNTSNAGNIIKKLNSSVSIIENIHKKTDPNNEQPENALNANSLIEYGAFSFGLENIQAIKDNVSDTTKRIIDQYIVGTGLKNVIPPNVKSKYYELITNDIKKYIGCLEYIKKRKDIIIELSDDDKIMLIDDLGQLKSLIYEIKPIENCNDLISEELNNTINKYLNIFRIIVPILVIVLSIIDFGKSMLDSKEEEMKKAQSKLITRLIISIVIFLIPTLITFLLTIANDIWGYINADTCGIA